MDLTSKDAFVPVTDGRTGRSLAIRRRDTARQSRAIGLSVCAP